MGIPALNKFLKFKILISHRGRPTYGDMSLLSQPSIEQQFYQEINFCKTIFYHNFNLN